MKFRLSGVALALTLTGMSMSWAQSTERTVVNQHQGHVALSTTVPTQDGNPAATAMEGMDHGSMGDAQGGTPPADARDPHAYSGGYQVGEGKYALPGTRQLKLADEQKFGALWMNRFERVNSSYGNSFAYDAQAWFGRDYDRLVLKAEGDLVEGKTPELRTEALWGHAIAPFWDTQLGIRSDNGGGPERRWLALGVQGLAPYWFDIDATAYLGEGGRTALRLSANYDILLTQRLILQPRVEFNFYGQKDEAREVGSGLSSGSTGLRLRYEFSRQVAPYVGVEWKGKYGATADLARSAGVRTEESRWVAGVRFWF
jgi:copper resistance protein B